MKQKENTSWQKVDKWYDRSVGEKGHYYHQNIILPNLSKMLSLKKAKSLLDLGCGQGVLARTLPSFIEYCGIDLAKGLIAAANQHNKNPKHHFQIADLTKPLNLSKKDFEIATIILALQNIEKPDQVFLNAAHHLQDNGLLAIVINHPCFRIPRQTSWQIDERKKMQYRRVDRYMSPLEIPIEMEPGKKSDSTQTWSFHYPLEAYFYWLKKSGFAVIDLQEWCSDKTSTGSAAKMENRAREEFPLFLSILAKKTPIISK